MVDSVLKEVRKVKENIAAEHNYDIRHMIASARREQKKHPERVVRLQDPHSPQTPPENTE